MNFETLIGYTFKNKTLLKQALTHSSADSSQNSRKSNERMEFLGDSVLSVVVSKYLYDSLKSHTEGELTKIRAGLVCEDALYRNAKKIGLGERLTMGRGEELSGGRDRKSILSDAFEALIAAIYLDSGLTAATDFIISFLPDKKTLEQANIGIGDYKSALQELVQQTQGSVIAYELTAEEGSAHEKVFFSNVSVNGKVVGSGSGKSKKESQQQAARAALIKLNKNV